MMHHTRGAQLSNEGGPAEPYGERTNMEFDHELDARGLNCPLPILKAKKSLTGMDPGQVLKIISTDPGSVKDFEAFARQTGNGLLSSNVSGNEFIFFLRKK